MLAHCLKQERAVHADLTVSLDSAELIQKKWETWFTSWTQALKTGPHKNF